MINKNKKFCPKFRIGLLRPRLWLSWLAVSVLFIFGFLPVKWREKVACCLACLVFLIAKKPLKIAHANICECFPDKNDSEIKELLKNNVRHFVQTLLSQAELLCCSEEKLRQRVELVGLENIQRAQQESKPIVFILPHVWGLEYAGLRLNLELPMVAMAKAHRNELFNWFSVKMRSSQGGDVYKREAGIRALISELKKGNSFFYLPDEDLGPERSVFAPFFGTQKATLPVVARIAQAGNAVILPTRIGYDNSQHKFVLTVMPACNLTEIVCKQSEASALNKMVEDSILAYPEQYMWFLKVLKTRPEGCQSVYR